MKKLVLITTLLLSIATAFAQGDDRVFSLNKVPEGWDNNGFALYYRNENRVYNMRSIQICDPGQVLKLKISPASFSVAVMYLSGKTRNIKLFSTLNGECFHRFKFDKGFVPVDFCFTADARNLVVLGRNQMLTTYGLKDYKPIKTIELPFMPNHMAMSNNNYFVALSDDDKVYVYNFETGAKRKTLDIKEQVNSIAFSANNAQLAVLTASGKMILFETKSFTKQNMITKLGDARECCFHPDGKYISVITSSNKVTILNIKDIDSRQYVESASSGISHIGYAKSLKGTNYLVYNTAHSFIFHPLTDLVPDYQKLVADNVDEKMAEWMKQTSTESMEEYHLRVNDETRQKKYLEIENEVTTELAGDLVEMSEVSLGNYDMDNSMLEVKFDKLPNIYLEVPQEEVSQFGNAKELVFDKSVYSVDDKDNFELIYTEVTNASTDKKYVFNNLEKKKLDYIKNEDSFVPLEFIQQTSLEEIRLESMKQEIVNQAMDSNLISNHTHINVKTSIESSTNADGEKILNYKIDFNYNVDKEFSMQDDYKVGKYICTESEAAMAMLKVVRKAFSEDFASYIVPGKKVLIEVYGSADATPIAGTIKYGGEYGDFVNELYYNREELGAMTVTRKTGITSNEQLSFVRAAGVKNYVDNNLRQLRDMLTDYTYHISVSEESGSEYRRIGVKFIFIDVFHE